MSIIDLERTVDSLKEWEKMAKEAEEMVDKLKDQLKKEMTKRNVEELEAGRYIIRFTTVYGSRFDTSAFKTIHADLYNMFLKPSTTKRFSVS